MLKVAKVGLSSWKLIIKRMELVWTMFKSHMALLRQAKSEPRLLPSVKSLL